MNHQLEHRVNKSRHVTLDKYKNFNEDIVARNETINYRAAGIRK